MGYTRPEWGQVEYGRYESVTNCHVTKRYATKIVIDNKILSNVNTTILALTVHYIVNMKTLKKVIFVKEISVKQLEILQKHGFLVILR